MKCMTIKMVDDSVWAVPVELITNHRAIKYEHKFNCIEESIKETKSLFKDESEIKDWAENNMDWADIMHYAKKIKDSDPDYQEGLVNGEKDFIDEEIKP